MLGFMPTDSIVVVFLSDKRLVCTARLENDNDAPNLVADARRSVARQAGDEVQYVVISFTDTTPNVEDYPDAIDVLRVHDGRYRSVMCNSESCCPPEGSPVRPSAAGLTMILNGSAPRPSREELERAAQQQETTDEAVATARQLRDLTVRDEAWFGLETLTELDDLRREAEKWLDVARHAGTDAAPAFFLAGWAFFRVGDGARANIAVDSALNLAPDYSAGKLLCTALVRGINGTQMPRMTADSLGSMA
jgi:hypothetical protein